MKEPLIILSGPTAVGKTRLSIQLAKAVNGEIISADSMQVYRHMDIGTAKITEAEMDSVRHHLIDCLNPDEEFNVTVFCTLAKQAIADIRSRGRLPIVVGGTGFYIQALLRDVDFTEEPREDGFREQLEKRAANGEMSALHEELRAVDPESAEAIPAANVKRVIRALEYQHYHQEPISVHNKREQEKESPYQYAYFVLTMDREQLYQRVNLRVDKMMEQGFLQEMEALKAAGYTDCTVAMQGLGYKQLLAYQNGECTLTEAVDRIKQETRHFAKRQLTWFRREKDVIFLDKTQMTEDEILEQIRKECQEKRIINE